MKAVEGRVLIPGRCRVALASLETPTRSPLRPSVAGSRFLCEVICDASVHVEGGEEGRTDARMGLMPWHANRGASHASQCSLCAIFGVMVPCMCICTCAYAHAARRRGLVRGHVAGQLGSRTYARGPPQPPVANQPTVRVQWEAPSDTLYPPLEHHEMPTAMPEDKQTSRGPVTHQSLPRSPLVGR